jgi:hypothetical protein
MPGRSADASRTLPRQRRGHSGRRLAALLGLLALLLVGGGLASLVLRDDNSDGGGSGTQAQSGGAQGEARSDASDEAPAGADSAAEGDGQPSGEGAGAAPGAPDGGVDGDGAVAGEQATGDSGQGAGAPAAPNAGAATAAGAESVTNPIGAIRAFYGRAARQDAVGVCALRGPRLQVRFTCAELTAQFARLRSVTFDRLELESEDDRTAVVAIATRAVHDGFTDRCRGTIQLVRGGADEWLVDGLDVTCKRN